MNRPRRFRSALVVLVAAGLVMALAACGLSFVRAVPDAEPSVGPGGVTPTAGAERLTGEIVVLAASSLADAFTELGTEFEARHPALSVTFSFGGSSGLAEQIVSGAPADVFASASIATMETAVAGLQDAEVAGADALEPALFAKNSMTLGVPSGNPGQITGLADLDRADVTFAVCEEQVPCGAAAVRVLEVARITALPVTYEKDVTAVLTKVRSDEVDAGIVYVTDIDDTVERVEIPADISTTTSYPILALPEAPNPDAAAAFTAFVLSDEGLAVLAGYGFAAP